MAQLFLLPALFIGVMGIVRIASSRPIRTEAEAIVECANAISGAILIGSALVASAILITH